MFPPFRRALLSAANGVLPLPYALHDRQFVGGIFLRILCEKDCIEYNKRSERPFAVFEPDRDPWYPETEKENPFLREIRYLVECIRQNRKPDIIKPEEVLYSLKIVLAVIRSVEENGRVIELPN